MRVVTGIAALDRARPSDLVFLDNAKYLDRLAATRAGVCLTTERFAAQAPAALTVLRTAQPFRDFVAVARKLFPDALRPRSLFESRRRGAGRHRASDGGDRGRRDHRPGRGDRPARRRSARAP